VGVGRALQVDVAQQLLDPLASLSCLLAEQAAAEGEELPAREVVVEVRVLGQVAEVVGRRVQLDHTPSRLHQAQRDLDRRGLSGAVGAQQAEHLAVRDREVHTGQDLHRPAPEPDLDGLTQSLDLDRRPDRHVRLPVTAPRTRRSTCGRPT
jgi:hypothetical protein